MLKNNGYDFLIMAIFWVAVIGTVIWTFSDILTKIRTAFAMELPKALETPLEILKRRYANGEISKEEFEAMRRDVGS